jgi:hypothetical protein
MLALERFSSKQTSLMERSGFVSDILVPFISVDRKDFGLFSIFQIWFDSHSGNNSKRRPAQKFTRRVELYRVKGLLPARSCLPLIRKSLHCSFPEADFGAGRLQYEGAYSGSADKLVIDRSSAATATLAPLTRN